jgi:tellurite resistance protein
MATAPLQHLHPGWFALVVGLAGLALAWHRAESAMGAAAGAVALVLAVLAAVLFALLLLASAWRAHRHPEALAEDLRHPVRHAFVAAPPVSVLLLATLGVALAGPAPGWTALWALGALLQLLATVWVLARWWRGPQAAGLQWPAVTPVLFIPIVGNVLVPLAGVPLGHPEWSAAQFGVGLLFWPVVTAMIGVRIASHGLWPERLRPVSFIFIAPPAVVGLSSLQLGAPPLVGWALWGMALFSLAWVAQQGKAIAALPFGLPQWGLSFPLAALAALTLRLAGPGGAMAALGTLLLAPEPVAAIQPAAASG